jgi:hypothetical protein
VSAPFRSTQSKHTSFASSKSQSAPRQTSGIMHAVVLLSRNRRPGLSRPRTRQKTEIVGQCKVESLGCHHLQKARISPGFPQPSRHQSQSAFFFGSSVMLQSHGAAERGVCMKNVLPSFFGDMAVTVTKHFNVTRVSHSFGQQMSQAPRECSGWMKREKCAIQGAFSHSLVRLLAHKTRLLTSRKAWRAFSIPLFCAKSQLLPFPSPGSGPPCSDLLRPLLAVLRLGSSLPH